MVVSQNMSHTKWYTCTKCSQACDAIKEDEIKQNNDYRAGIVAGLRMALERINHLETNGFFVAEEVIKDLIKQYSGDKNG